MSISARIERVRAEDLLDEPVSSERAPGPGISRRRQLSVVALVGGLVVALLAAIAGALLINYYFVEPRHTLTIAHTDQAVALVVFVAVAAIVSLTDELAARRARIAEQASEQAETLSQLTTSDRKEPETLKAVLTKARETFNMEIVALKA